MTGIQYDMKNVLDIPLWERMQDQLAKMTGTAIICIDYKGNPMTKHSGRTEFCSVIRENPVSRKRCYRCDALAGLEAVRLERPYIYLCHCGIVDVAVPVMVGDKYLGAVMFGQVRLVNKDREKAVRLVNEISSFQAEEDAARKDLLEKYEKLPEMEYERIMEIAEFVDSVVKYTVDRAVKSRNQAETYQWMLSMSAEQGNGDIEIQEIRELESPTPANSQEQLPVKPSSAIYPAVVYIHNHPRESVSMKEMANLCHLSPSYFSRRFSQETGETFVNYINRRKIEKAKELLRGSNKSINHIAEEAGFQNTNNFIAVFKRIEGVTPSLYRQYLFK